MKLVDYLDAAKRRAGNVSDHELSKMLGRSRSYVTQLRMGRAWPSPLIMRKLGPMAGVEAGLACIDLLEWRAEDEEMRAHWRHQRELGERTLNFVLSKEPGLDILNDEQVRAACRRWLWSSAAAVALAVGVTLLSSSDAQAGTTLVQAAMSSDPLYIITN